MERFPGLDKLVDEKFLDVSKPALAKSNPWTNMGSDEHRIIIGEEKFTNSTKVAEHFLMKSGNQGRVLDLGTGNGALLTSLHRKLGVEMNRLVGVTAFDHIKY